MRRRVKAFAVVGVLLLGMLLPSVDALSVGADGILPPNNPLSNLAPSPNFLSSGVCRVTSSATPCANPCVHLAGSNSNLHAVFPAFNGSPSCTQYLVRALDAARSNEGLTSISLPSNWFRLKPQEQIFVIVDLERTARGLPPYLGLNRRLHAAAQYAANREIDPTYATGFRAGVDPQGVRGMGGALAMGFATLEADYVWMYDDGWGGSVSLTPNFACTFASALGCWGHRDQMLGYDGTYNFGVGLHCTTCEMGTGFAIVRGTGSFTSLIELPAGAPPPMYFTWAKNVLPFLTTAPGN